MEQGYGIGEILKVLVVEEGVKDGIEYPARVTSRTEMGQTREIYSCLNIRLLN